MAGYLFRKNIVFFSGFFIFTAPLSAQDKACDFSKLQEPLKSYTLAFKNSEALSLGEKVSPQKNKGIELIERAKSKYWKSFDWQLRPLEFFAVLNAEELYFKCETKREKILSVLVDDLLKNKISSKDKHKAMNTLLLLVPCLEDPDHSLVLQSMGKEFTSSTEDFVTFLIAADSDTTKYLKDYQACKLKPYKKFQLIDSIVLGIDRHIARYSFDRNLALRLKKLRASKMHFESARHFFEKIDSLLIRKEKI